MKLYLVRHGETDWNAAGRLQGLSDIALNATGLAQAECLAEKLTGETNFAAIYTSPLQRAARTAEIIGARLGVRVTLDKRLVEHGLGDLEGLTRAQLEEKFPDAYRKWQQSPRVRLAGQETREEIQARVSDFLDELRSSHAGENVIIITHGGTMSDLIGALLALDPQRPYPFRFDNASVSVIEIGDSNPHVWLLNDTCHLRVGSPFLLQRASAVPPTASEILG